MGRKALQHQSSPKMGRRALEFRTEGSNPSSQCTSPHSPSFNNPIAPTSTPVTKTQDGLDSGSVVQRGVDVGGIGLDRVVLERSLGRLIAEQGLNLLREVASTNGGIPLETLLNNPDILSSAARRQPLDLSAISDLNLDALLSAQDPENTQGSPAHASMPDLSQHGESSTSTSPTATPTPGAPRKSSLSSRQKERQNISVNDRSSTSKEREIKDSSSTSSSGSAPTALEVSHSGSSSKGRHHR